MKEFQNSLVDCDISYGDINLSKDGDSVEKVLRIVNAFCLLSSDASDDDVPDVPHHRWKVSTLRLVHSTCSASTTGTCGVSKSVTTVA